MPGEPVETFIGVTALGIGVLVIYSAVKNVSPVALLKETVQSGTFADISKLPKLVGGKGPGSATDLNQMLKPNDPKLPSNAGPPIKCIKGEALYDPIAKRWECVGADIVPNPGGDPNGGGGGTFV